LGCFGHKFIKFDEHGRPYDLVEFHGHQQHTSDHYSSTASETSVYFVVYWHEFQYQNDSGVNKQMFIGGDLGIEKAAEKFFQDKVQEKKCAAVLMKVDRAKGMEFLSHEDMGSSWHRNLLKRAKQEYF
jgi:hypothetical protein